MQQATIRAGVAAALLLLTSASLSAQDTWTSLDTGTSQDLYGVHFVSADVGYAAGAAGTVIKTTDGGENWQDVSPGVTNDLYGTYFFDANTGLVIGTDGGIWRTTDGGTTWSSVPSGTTSSLHSVSFSGDVGIVGANSMGILRSDDQGASWTVVQDGFFGFPFHGAHMLSSTHGFLVGQNAIFQPIVGFSVDGGHNWDFATFYLNGNEGSLRDIHFLDEQNGFAVGAVWDGSGSISRSQNGGQSWTTTLFPDPLYAIDFATAEVGVAAGAGGAILETTDGGQTWMSVPSVTGQTLYSLSLPTASVGYAAGGGGTVLKGTFGASSPVALVVTPIDPPIEVLPGESFQFTVAVTNSGTEPVTVDLWAEAEHVDSGASLTRGPRRVTLPAGATREATVTQRVPPRAPAGSYTYDVFAGTFPDEAFTSDGFTATVLGSEGGALTADGWDLSFGPFEAAAEAGDAAPARLVLEQNAPNPFNPQTVIRYSLPEGAHVALRVYDALGQQVAVLADGYRAAGRHEVHFDASELSAGVYFYVLEAGTVTESRRMLLLK